MKTIIRFISRWAWAEEIADKNRIDLLEAVGKDSLILADHQRGNRSVRVAIDVAFSDESAR